MRAQDDDDDEDEDEDDDEDENATLASVQQTLFHKRQKKTMVDVVDQEDQDLMNLLDDDDIEDFGEPKQANSTVVITPKTKKSAAKSSGFHTASDIPQTPKPKGKSLSTKKRKASKTPVTPTDDSDSSNRTGRTSGSSSVIGSKMSKRRKKAEAGSLLCSFVVFLHFICLPIMPMPLSRCVNHI